MLSKKDKAAISAKIRSLVVWSMLLHELELALVQGQASADVDPSAHIFAWHRNRFATYYRAHSEARDALQKLGLDL